MSRPKRTFDREFKLQVIRALEKGEKSLAQTCREHGLCQTLVRHWREQYRQRGENAWLQEQPGGHVGEDPQARIAALEAALGRAHLEIDFLRQALSRAEKGGSSHPERNRP